MGLCNISEMIPLVLELDEQLNPGEVMKGIKTIGLQTNEGSWLLGYVAIIFDEGKGFNYLRYGSLRAYHWDKTMEDIV